MLWPPLVGRRAASEWEAGGGGTPGAQATLHVGSLLKAPTPQDGKKIPPAPVNSRPKYAAKCSVRFSAKKQGKKLAQDDR